MFSLIYHNQGRNFGVKYQILTLDYVGKGHFGHHLMSLGPFYAKYFSLGKNFIPLILYSNLNLHPLNNFNGILIPPFNKT